MRTVIVFLFTFICSSNSFAWGLTGHRVVAEIASFYLTPKAKKQIAHLLDNESMAMVANWSDFIKSDTSYKYTNSWHYTNLPDGLEQNAFVSQLKNLSEANAYGQISQLSDILKNPKATKEEKNVALKFLIHIVGDVHQPMHVGRKEDLGGNKIYVKWFGKKSNLHRVWDEDLVDYQQLSYTEMAQAYNVLAKANYQVWEKDPMEVWLFESYQLSRELYADIAAMNEADPNLKYDYDFKHNTTLRTQLAKGGVRLATLLNQIFR